MADGRLLVQEPTTSNDVTLGTLALRTQLHDHRIRSAESLPGRPDWVRLTFDDQSALDLPTVCLTSDTLAPAHVPRPRPFQRGR
jgi:hypothetical protein